MVNSTLSQLNLAVRDFFQKQLNVALTISHDINDDSLADVETEIQLTEQSIKRQIERLKNFDFKDISQSDYNEVVSTLPLGTIICPDHKIYLKKILLRSSIESSKYLVRQLKCEFSEDGQGDQLFRGIVPTSFFDPFEISETLNEPKTVERACAQFVKVKSTSNSWVPKTKRDYHRVFELFMHSVEKDKPIAKLDTNDVKAFRDLIAKLPANVSKMKGSGEKSLEIIMQENTSAPLLSMTTQLKYFGLFRSFLRWLQDEEEISKMPGPNIKVMGTSKKSLDARAPYSSDQLKAIFTSPLYLGCQSLSRRSKIGDQIFKDGYYWVPLVSLFSGMRLGEIVQLRCSDIKEDKGIFHFDISTEEGTQKSLKTTSSKRRIPIHHLLVENGLLKLLQEAKKNGHDRIFWDIKPGKDGYFSHNFSKWWGHQMKNLGFKFEKTAFHSFRHSFTDALREAETPDSVAKALVGHADNSVHAAYGSGHSLQKLADFINKVSYPIDF